MIQWLFTGLVLLVGLERLAELVVSKRNAAWAFARGGVETGPAHYPVMVVLHTGLLVGAVVEVWLADRPFVPALGWPMLALVVAAPGAALVVHRDPRPPVEHPRHRRARAPARSTGGPYRCLPTRTTSPSSSRASRCRSCTPPGSRRSSSPSPTRPCSTVRIRVENAALATSPRRRTRQRWPT